MWIAGRKSWITENLNPKSLLISSRVQSLPVAVVRYLSLGNSVSGTFLFFRFFFFFLICLLYILCYASVGCLVAWIVPVLWFNYFPLEWNIYQLIWSLYLFARPASYFFRQSVSYLLKAQQFQFEHTLGSPLLANSPSPKSPLTQYKQRTFVLLAPADLISDSRLFNSFVQLVRC